MNFFQKTVYVKQLTLEELRDKCSENKNYHTTQPENEYWQLYPFLEDIIAMYNPNHHTGKEYHKISKMYVSNIGNVKVIYKDGSQEVLEQNELEQGYWRLKKYPGFDYVYRLVADTWLIKPQGKNIVHHIDNDGKNNSVNNLIWVDKEEHYKIHH